MYPESTTSSASSFPMAPLSGQWPPKNTTAAANAAVPMTSSNSAPLSKTSLEITIVTTEQVPNGVDGATTTVERKLKMRLALPPSYNTKQLKSLNVRLHQDAPAQTTSPVATVALTTPEGNYSMQGPSSGPVPAPAPVLSSTPSSALNFHDYNHKNTVKAQQLLRQKQLLYLYQAAKNKAVSPAIVSSSQDFGTSTTMPAINSSMPIPETVSSSSSSSSSNKNNKKRRRSTRDDDETRNNTTAATQSLRRTKRKVKTVTGAR